MPYFLGTLRIRCGGMALLDDRCVIAAKNEDQAFHLLDARASDFAGEGESSGDEWLFDGGTLAVSVYALHPICAVTYQELERVLPAVRAEGYEAHELKDDAWPQAVRTLARRLGEHLARHGEKVAHSKLLHAIGASVGETDWQVLASKGKTAAAASGSHALRLVFGSDDVRAVERGANPRTLPTYSELAFASAAELEAYLQGVDNGSGWGDYAVIDDVPPQPILATVAFSDEQAIQQTLATDTIDIGPAVASGNLDESLLRSLSLYGFNRLTTAEVVALLREVERYGPDLGGLQAMDWERRHVVLVLPDTQALLALRAAAQAALAKLAQ